MSANIKSSRTHPTQPNATPKLALRETSLHQPFARQITQVCHYAQTIVASVRVPPLQNTLICIGDITERVRNRLAIRASEIQDRDVALTPDQSGRGSDEDH